MLLYHRFCVGEGVALGHPSVERRKACVAEGMILSFRIINTGVRLVAVGVNEPVV